MIGIDIKRKQILLASLLFTWIVIVVTIHYIADQGRISSMGGVISYLSKYDTLAHFMVVGLLGFFVSMVSKKQVNIGAFAIPRLIIILIIAVCIEETTQLFRIHRGFSFSDMLANVLGILSFNFLADLIKTKYFYQADEIKLKS